MKKKIKPQEAQPGDRVHIAMQEGADRSGTVKENNIEEKRLELENDNFVSISVAYSRIDKIEKVISPA